MTWDAEVEDGTVQHCLLAGANPIRPGGAAGHLPLQHLCTLHGRPRAVAGPWDKVVRNVEQAASQLSEAAPLVLIMAFTQAQNKEAMLPLEAAARHATFSAVLVPVLSKAVSRLLLRLPALAAAPLLKRAIQVAHEHFPDVTSVICLVEITRAVAPCLDNVRDGKHPIWEPRCAFEDWTLRERRLAILRPLLAQIDHARDSCEHEEAVTRLAELEAVLERRRRQHAEQIAELQLALDKAQRAAEEAGAQAQAALRSQRSCEVRVEPTRYQDSKSDTTRGQSLPKSGSSPESPAELLRNIRQQRGLDIDYSTVPAEVLRSASAMQRSIGAAVERLAIDLYASKGHFLLELIQNADDNRYEAQGTKSCLFVLLYDQR